MFSQRSQGAPAGLSINTGNATSLFGSTASSQPQQPGGLFGATTQNNKSSGGLFGSSQTAPQLQGGGLFGGQSAGQQGGGLFGSQSTQQQGGGLFGSGTAQQSQPQQGGGLFGSLGQSTNQPQQGGGLFGNLGTQSKGSSLFGNTPSQNQQPANPQQPSSLFSTTQSQPQQQPPPPPPQQQQQPRPSLFNSSLSMGQSTLPQSQQPPTIPGVRIDVSAIRGTSRFNDLHDELQKQIETIDTFIQTQMHFQSECDSVQPKIESQSLYIPNDVDFVGRKLDTMQRALENDAAAIDGVRKSVKKDAADARLSFRAIDNLKLPQQYHYTGLWNVPAVSASAGPRLPGDDDEGGDADLVSYFEAQAEEMGRTLEGYRRSVRDIEEHLKGIETSTVQQMQQLAFTRGRDGGQRSAEDQVRELAAVLREFENGIMAVAGKVGGAREGVTELIVGGAGPQNGRGGRRF